MIFQSAVVNNATVQLTALAPTSATVKDKATYGDGYITHMLALCSTDDVQNVYIVPDGLADANGIPCNAVSRYSATGSVRLVGTKLTNPIRIPSNGVIRAYAQSETAANTVVYLWLGIQYANGSFVQAVKGDAVIRRALNSGAALTSNVERSGTAITDLQAGRKYQVQGIAGVGVNGQTAGIVGPAFVRFGGPAEYLNSDGFIPLSNGGSYVATGSLAADFAESGIPQPTFGTPQTLQPYFIGFTAEQVAAQVMLAVDKAYV